VRLGFRRHYRIAPWTDCMEIHWGSGCQVYVTPVSRHEICAVVISRDPRLRLDHALPDFPDLHARLKNAPATPERGAVSATRRLARIDHGRVILVGDASGSVDAITGEGLRLGFEQGMALADALARGDVESYRAAHRRLARRPHFMAGLMLLLDRSARLRRYAMDALSSEPKLFAAQLAMHVGVASAADLVWNSLIPLGRNILAASAEFL
jgi:menaquinone-9 beta-reductase